LRNIGEAKYIVCPTNPIVGRATARLAHYVPAPMLMVITIQQATLKPTNKTIICKFIQILQVYKSLLHVEYWT